MAATGYTGSGGGGGGGTPSNTVVSETSYGQASTPGVSATASRGDHTHGTMPLPTPAAIGAVALALIDAKGDLFVGTGNDALARFPVGANGLFLKADSTTGTGLTWAAPSVTGGSGTSVLKTVSQAKQTSGSITCANGVLTQVGTDLIIAASAGNILAIDIEALCNASSFPLQFEAATRNAGNTADLNYWSSGGAASLNPGGIPNWYVEGVSGKFGVPGGRAMYVVQAGDISAGNVRVRLYGFGAGGARDVLASASYPFRWHVNNLGS